MNKNAEPEVPKCPHCGQQAWRAYVQYGSYVLRCGNCQQNWCATSYCAIGPEDSQIVEAVADIGQSTENGVAMIAAELFKGDQSRIKGIKQLHMGTGLHRDLYQLISSLAEAGAFIWLRWLSEEDSPRRETAPELLEAFDDNVRRSFLFLSQDYGAHHNHGASLYDAPCPTLEPKAYSLFAGSFFWWINRYRTDLVTLDICFGGKEFLLEPRLFYPSGKSFAPWELLYAAKLRYEPQISGEWWVMSCAKLENVVLAMAAELKKHWRFFIDPGQKILDLALIQREQRMVSASAEQRKKDRVRACSAASKAFHEKRYEDAVRLLAPFEIDEELTVSARKLLALARRQIEGKSDS